MLPLPLPSAFELWLPAADWLRWIDCASCRVYVLWSSYHSADGIATEAALVRVEQTAKVGQYALVNMGKASHPIPPTSGSYISFCSDGLWVRCDGYQRDKAMTVQLLKPGAPAPPAPPPTPVRVLDFL